MKAYNTRYQKFYDKIEKRNLLGLVEKTIKMFDIDGYIKFRLCQGYHETPHSTQDFIVELLSVNYGNCSSGQLMVSLNNHRCMISYGDIHSKVQDAKHSVSLDLREYKLIRILNR